MKISQSLYDLLYPTKTDDFGESEEEYEEFPMKEIIVDGVPQMVKSEFIFTD